MSSSKKDDNLVREGQVTYEMYAAMPDDGQRYEIIDGSLEAMSPGPSYARFGVPEYWVVDPEARTLELYRLHEGSNLYELRELFNEEDIVVSDKLPCVNFTLSETFANMLQ